MKLSQVKFFQVFSQKNRRAVIFFIFGQSRLLKLHLSFTRIRQAIWRLKALHIGRLNIQFQQDWQKDKKLQLF